MSELRIVGLRGIPEVQPGADLVALILAAAEATGVGFEDGDILVVTQKIVSKAEGRLVRVEDVVPSPLAESLGARWGKDPRRIEVVLRESARIVRMDRGLIIAETRHGFVCANAGVDESNVAGEGVLALLPLDPDASAERIRAGIRERTGAQVGVVISDTFGRPWRAGLTDVAIGVAGFLPLDDFRGRCDPYGRELKVTMVAVADELASAAELAAGKVAGIPAVLIRGYRAPAGDGNARQLVRAPEHDLFR
ncbi:MAG: coenzyme F420-0:L-glutamate ligase [Dehalococcoidia bacterium]|nr:coenzyme F420-0:L-glutamate ligase [Dehalococcoidia bacterium]